MDRAGHRDRRRARGAGLATSCFLAATLIGAALFAGGFIFSDPFPGDRVGARDGGAARLLVDGATLRGPASGPRGAVLGTSTSSARAAGAERAQRRLRARLRARRQLARAGTPARATPTPTRGRKAPAPGEDPAAPTPPADEQPVSVREPVQGGANTLRSSGQELGDQAGAVSEPAGEAVTRATDTAAGAVETVGSILP